MVSVYNAFFLSDMKQRLEISLSPQDWYSWHQSWAMKPSRTLSHNLKESLHSTRYKKDCNQPVCRSQAFKIAKSIMMFDEFKDSFGIIEREAFLAKCRLSKNVIWSRVARFCHFLSIRYLKKLDHSWLIFVEKLTVFVKIGWFLWLFDYFGPDMKPKKPGDPVLFCSI